MNEEPKGFLSRWSQRKVQVRQGVAPVAAEPALSDTAPAAHAVPASPASPAIPAAAALAVPGQVAPQVPQQVPPPTPGAAAAASPDAPAAQATQPPRPTLQDVEALTPESDFTRFMARDVDPQVKNSAMKKLFADPHYNVMDRLDTYIDDYNTPDPIPKAMFRQMVQARMLGLLDDEMEDQAGALGSSAVAAPSAPAAGAPSEAPEVAEVAHDAAQTDEAEGAEGAERAERAEGVDTDLAADTAHAPADNVRAPEEPRLALAQSNAVAEPTLAPHQPAPVTPAGS